MIAASPSLAKTPHNVILCIGDGMGPEHVRAASLYAHGREGALPFESFPAQGIMTVHAADDPITDSAASATAMATGRKVNNGVIAVAVPGPGHVLDTLLKRAQRDGKSVGLVTTTELTHATPAAFAAHTPSRKRRDVIARDYLTRTRPDVLLGGGGAGLYPDDARAAGYTVAQNRDELEQARADRGLPLCGLFGEGNMPYMHDDFIGDTNAYETLPTLSEMTMAAIDLLAEDPDGFFLVVEGGRIDHAAHDHEIDRNIHETIEFANTVEQIAHWMSGRDDSLLVITADHETGGMEIVAHEGEGHYPEVTWSTWHHTDVPVGIYALGRAAHLFEGIHENTHIPRLIQSAGDAPPTAHAPGLPLWPAGR